MRMRAGEIRAWRAAMRARARVLALARAEALPQRPTPEPGGDGATTATLRRSRPALFLARLFASPANRLALIVLAVAALYRLILLLRGWPALDSDEAIIGLMARHILHGQFDYWFWGQQYMGAFQAYVVAGVFAAIGSSAFSLHLTMLLFALVFLAAMYFVGRAAYGPVVGLLTLAWLAVGPPVAVLRELTAIGGYQDMLVFGSLILLGVWSRLRKPAPLPRTRDEWRRALLVYAGIGLASGIGFWSDLLFLPVLVMAAFVLLAARTREVLHYCGLMLVLAFLVGGFPYISYNITNKNATYKEIVRQTHPNGTQAATLPPPGDWLNQIGETFSVAVPVVLASPHVCVNQGGIWPAYPPAEAEVNYAPPGACDGANIAFSLAAVFIYLTVAWQLALVVRRWLVDRLTRLTSPPPLASSTSAIPAPAPGGLQSALRAVHRQGSHGGRCRAPTRAGVRGTPRAAGRPRWDTGETRRSRQAEVGHFSAAILRLNTTAVRRLTRRGIRWTPALAAPDTSPTFALSPDESARLWLRLMLLGIAGMTLALYTTNQDAQRYQFTSSRYLLLLYLTTPLLLGPLWSFAAPRLQPFLATVPSTASRFTAFTSAPSGDHEPHFHPHRQVGAYGIRPEGWEVRSILATLALLALLALSVGGGILTLAYAFDGQRFALPAPPRDRELIAYLDAHHITAFYSDYWTCYRSMFETNERLTCAVRGQNGDIGLELINNRNDAYIQAVAQHPYPAYVLPADTLQDRYFVNEAVIENLPHIGYRRVVLDGYAIYYHP